MTILGAWWVVFEDRKPGCFEAETEIAARTEAATLGKVKEIHDLPYPSSPRLSAVKSDCLAFCYGGRKCFGLSSCPQNIACTE